jgi:hypothetical protein
MLRLDKMKETDPIVGNVFTLALRSSKFCKVQVTDNSIIRNYYCALCSKTTLYCPYVESKIYLTEYRLS